LVLLFLGVCCASAFAVGPVPVSATWTGEGDDANWTTGGNWDGGSAPGSSVGTSDISYATFNVADNTAVTVDAWRNIKFIQFGGSAQNAFAISGGTLVLTAGGSIVNFYNELSLTHAFASTVLLEGNATFEDDSVSSGSNLSFSGGITSGVSGGTQTLTLGGSNVGRSEVSGVIGDGTGTVALNKTGAGTWTLSGANTYSGGTTITAGTLKAGNAAAVGSGALTNNATLDIGTTDLSVDGTYTQSSGSTLKLTANSSSSFGKIASVGHVAVVDADSTVNVTVGGYIPDNATLEIINTGGLGIGDVPDTVTSTDSFIQFSADDSGGNLVLVANRSSSGFQSSGGNSNEAAVGAVLDNVADPSSDMTFILDTLEDLSSEEVASAESSMAPLADGGLVDSTNASLDKFVGQAILRLQDSKVEEEEGEAALPQTDPLKNDVWLQTYGNYAHQDARGLSNGYLARLWGVIIGIDRSFTDSGLRLGAAEGFGGGRVLSKDNCGRTRVMSYQTGFYGEYDAKDHPYVLDGVLTYGYNDYDSSRNVTVGAIERTARSNYSGQQVSAYVEGGYKVKTGSVDVIPLLAIDYTHLHIAGYTETGADALNLSVRPQSYDTLQLGAGFRISRAMETENLLFTPEVHFRYFYAVVNDSQETFSSFSGGGTSFQTKGLRPAPSSFNFGVRFEFFNKKNLTLLTDIDAVFKDGYYEGGGSLTAKYSF